MKSVHELSAEELQELRSSWYHQHLDDGTLEEVVGREVQDEEEIPMDIVITYYEGTYFVEEDFFCNLTEEEEQDVQEVFDKLVSLYDTVDFLEDSGEDEEAQKVRTTLDLVSSFLIGIMDKK